MRRRGWMLGLVVAMLIAAPAARAQQPAQQAPQEQNPPSGKALPDRIIEDVRGLFRSLFGGGETPLLLPPPVEAQPEQKPSPQSSSSPPGEANPERQAAKPAAAAGAQPPPVEASPNAAAAPLSLHSAIAKGDYANALKMIEQGTDIEAKDPGAGASPLVGLLVQRGADVNSRTKSGTSPLHTAVLYGRREVAEYLLDKGADVNAKSASGATPLSLAQAANFDRIGKMLRSRGAK